MKLESQLVENVCSKVDSLISRRSCRKERYRRNLKLKMYERKRHFGDKNVQSVYVIFYADRCVFHI